MSDSPSPHDAAILILRERANAIELDINERTLAIDRQRERLDEVQELIAVLSRKGKTRRPRVVESTGALPASATHEEAASMAVFGHTQGTERPSVFASPPAPDAA